MNNPNKPHKSCARFTAEYLMLIAELHLQKISNECEELIKTYFTKRNIDLGVKTWHQATQILTTLL